MRHTVIVFALNLLPALIGGCGAESASPSGVPSTVSSLVASLTGNYTLVVTVDDHCSQIAVRQWVYRAALVGSGGNFLSVRVIGGGYNEMTNVGQMYAFMDSTARFVWTFGSDDFDVPLGPTRLSLYGSSDTVIRNGSINGTIVGSASTTDNYYSCYGAHSFSLVSTG